MFGQDEVLVAAKQLLGLDGIEVADDLNEVIYHHFLFDQHELVTANGLQCESLFTGPEALRAVGAVARHQILAMFPQFPGPTIHHSQRARSSPVGRPANSRSATCETASLLWRDAGGFQGERRGQVPGSADMILSPPREPGPKHMTRCGPVH